MFNHSLIALIVLTSAQSLNGATQSAAEDLTLLNVQVVNEHGRG
jgi:hypothetical protein